MTAHLVFGAFSFDPVDRILWRGDERVPLAPKAIEALALLLAVPGSLVAKETLRDALWPGGFVEDGNLTQTVYLLRRTLDPAGDGRAFIETVPRRGYRFVAPMTVRAAPPVTEIERLPFARRALGIVAFVVLVLGIGAFAQSRGSGTSGLHGEAARMYALGRYYWNQRSTEGFRESIHAFERVVALAPNDPLGYAGLADAYYMAANYDDAAIAPPATGYAKAEHYARAALARDARSGEAIATLGYLAFDRDRDLDRSRTLLERALVLRPGHATAHEVYAMVRLYGGDTDAALAHFQRATELDPISSPILTWYGIGLYYAGRLDESRIALRQALQVNPRNVGALHELVLVDERLDRVAEARTALRRLGSSHHLDKTDTVMLAALLDLRAHARPAALPDLIPRKGTLHPYAAAALCLALGRRSDALNWIDLAVHDPEKRLSRRLLVADPRFAELRGDARFRTLTS